VDKKRQRCQSSEEISDFFPVRSKLFCVAIGGHGRNLLVSLKPGIKATMNGVAVWWPTPFQKIQGAKICWESFRLDFWIKAASSSLINFQIAKISTRCFTNRCWSHLWDILKEKRCGEVTEEFM
jgi:hypothetical protein